MARAGKSALFRLWRTPESIQIARSVNAGIAGAEDAKRALSMLDRVYELMYEIAKK